MKILKCQFSDGAIIPVLLYSNNSCPVFLPLTYTVLCLRGKSYRTCYDSIFSLKALYTFYNSQGLNLEELAIAGEFRAIFEKTDSLIHFLYTNGQSATPTSNQLFDTHLRSLKFFFKWLVAKYNKDSGINYLTLTEQKFVSSSIHRASASSQYKSLDDNLIQQIRDLVIPTSDKNPFKSKNRLRNWLIIELLLQTGIRSGELQNLHVPDIYKSGDSYYLRIRRSDQNEIMTDTRWQKPSIKNDYSVRTVAISKILYMGFEKYLLAGRKKKSAKIKHGYLFTSERGTPLAQTSLSAILRRIQAYLVKERISTTSITPHMLRHTFVEKMLKYLIETKNIDMERAKDELRNICGWSINSPMPNYYARRYISIIANKHNMERVAFSMNQ